MLHPPVNNSVTVSLFPSDVFEMDYELTVPDYVLYINSTLTADYQSITIPANGSFSVLYT